MSSGFSKQFNIVDVYANKNELGASIGQSAIKEINWLPEFNFRKNIATVVMSKPFTTGEFFE